MVLQEREGPGVGRSKVCACLFKSLFFERRE